MNQLNGRAAREAFQREWSELHYGTASAFCFTPTQEQDLDARNLCTHAQDFDRWCRHTFAPLTSAPTANMLPKAFQMLLHEFVARHRYLPLEHQRKSPFRGHMCVFEVFRMEYDYIKEIEDANMLCDFQPREAPQRPTRSEYFEAHR